VLFVCRGPALSCDCDAVGTARTEGRARRVMQLTGFSGLLCYGALEIVLLLFASNTSAAITSLPHTITNLLQSNPFVTVISFDFSEAFDTIRHSTLLSKLALDTHQCRLGLGYLRLVPKTLFCSTFASHINKNEPNQQSL